MEKILSFTVALVVGYVSTVYADPGDTIWTRTYGGSNNDYDQSVQQTSEGGYVIAGRNLCGDDIIIKCRNYKSFDLRLGRRKGHH